MRDKPWYPVVYMFVLTAVFSGALVVLARATETRVERNEKLFRMRAVVVAMGLIPEERGTTAPAAEVEAEFERLSWRPLSDDPRYPRVEFVLPGPDGEPEVYGVEISGQGFWDKMSGVVGIDADGETVVGVTFFEQYETPGLGAEVTRFDRFRQHFVGRKLAPGERPLTMVAEGTELGPHEVYAVTGATQTSTRLARFMNVQLDQWRTGLAVREQPPARRPVGEVDPFGPLPAEAQEAFE